MSVTSKELIEERRDEIMAACEQLYQTMSFKEITIREIGKITPFGRTSIYNYFQTKEEIFLAILQREYDLWADDLKAVCDADRLTNGALAEALSHTIEKRVLMLKLLAMNMYDIEENSDIEKLKQFKHSYKNCLDMLLSVLEKHRPDMTDKDRDGFMYSLLPFLFGVYPYCHVMDKQKQAMDEIGFDYPSYTVYELVFGFISKLL